MAINKGRGEAEIVDDAAKMNIHCISNVREMETRNKKRCLRPVERIERIEC